MSSRPRINRRTALGLGLGIGLGAGAGVAAPLDAGNGGRMRCWEVGERTPGALTLHRAERPIPVPGPGQVLLKVRATGINAVDVAALHGVIFKVGGPTLIPLQDNVSDVVALGPGVTEFAPGDRVTTTLYIEWINGPWNSGYMRSMIGLGVDGFLTEYAVMPAATLARVPARFTNEEACTLAIAGLTSWRALSVEAKLLPGETVVTTGTGGVSTFGVQIAKMLGARVIVTSSSDAKLARMRELGADVGINYRTTPDWAAEVRKATGGRGADVVMNNVGWPEMMNSLRACGPNARLIHVGSGPPRADMTNWPNLTENNVWIKAFTMAGRNMLGGFLSALEHTTLKPVVERVFDFDDAPDAVRFMETTDRIGKIVIRIS